MSRSGILYWVVGLALLSAMGCGVQPVISKQAADSTPASAEAASTEAASSVLPVTGPTDLAVASHLSQPADIAVAKQGTRIYDVDSSGTGPQKRAPYGDSYTIDRFERPFLKDMTYVPDLDIQSFSLAQDADWNYISIQLAGSNPNNPIGIDYGAEIDVNGDGRGDYLLVAHAPFSREWNTGIVQIFEDTNHDVGSGSSVAGDGYETRIFDGGSNKDADPDLAWARMRAGDHATVQIAFKKSWLGAAFAFDVVADAGMKDAGKFDYNSQFSLADAGSPVRSSKYYPLRSLFAVDNTCWDANHLQTVGNELVFCPVAQAPAAHSKQQSCTPIDPTQCDNGYNPSICQCNP